MAKCLILGGCGNVFFNSEMGEELFDFGCTHFARVAFVVEEDKALDPIYIGLFGANGIVFEADGVAHLVKEFFLGLFHRFSICDWRFSIVWMETMGCKMWVARY